MLRLPEATPVSRTEAAGAVPHPGRRKFAAAEFAVHREAERFGDAGGEGAFERRRVERRHAPVRVRRFGRGSAPLRSCHPDAGAQFDPGAAVRPLEQGFEFEAGLFLRPDAAETDAVRRDVFGRKFRQESTERRFEIDAAGHPHGEFEREVAPGEVGGGRGADDADAFPGAFLRQRSRIGVEKGGRRRFDGRPGGCSATWRGPAPLPGRRER